MISFRKQLSEKMTTQVLNKIRDAPKPTKVAEALAVVKQFPGIAVSLDEIAEIRNISDPGNPEKSKASEYNPDEIGKHPEMRIVRTPGETLVRYVGSAYR